jgi:hypothetical protein
MTNYLKLSSVALLISFLTACGGGGGGGGSSDDRPVSNPVNGSASKGIIAQGAVSVWQVSAGQRPVTPIAQWQTSDIGEFSGNLPVTSGQMLYVEVRGNADGSSTMYCDLPSCGQATSPALDTNQNGIVDFGEWTAIDDDIVISAYVQYQGGSIPVRVNLLTHMVSQSFENTPTSDELEEAYEELQARLELSNMPDQLVPFPSEETQPITINQLKDNLVVQGLLANLGATTQVAEAVATVAGIYQQDPELASDTISDADITRHAIELTELLEGSPLFQELTPEEVSSLTEDLNQRHDEAAEDENKLSLSDLPMLPPELL